MPKKFPLMAMIGLICLMIIATACNKQEDGQKGELASYLSANYQSPEEYLISCFEDHDIVFIGEYHRIKHDAELIQNLIPLLHQAGVYNLGMEFANYADQPMIDRLITANEYDEALAREIQFRQWPFWGFQEYVDIYRVAWELNRSLPDDSTKFRVVGLNAVADWSHVWTVEDRKNPEIMKKVWPDGNSDEHMAKVISTEFIANDQKAVIYCGIYHGFTRFHQPVYDVEADSLIRLDDRRMGNRIYSEMGDRCMTVSLHTSWPSLSGHSESVRPADGAIDKVCSGLDPGRRRCGFDVIGSPFASLSGETSYWRHGYPEFTLAEYCDGYIYQMPLADYEGCTVIEGFINESNRLAAISQSANPKTKDSSNTVESMMEGMRADTDFKRRFSQFGVK